MENPNVTELRSRSSRSRSKTPFLRSSCDRETCAVEGHNHETIEVKENLEKIMRNSPVVKLSPIDSSMEEVFTTKVVKTVKTQQQRKSTRHKTSDYSSDDSEMVANKKPSSKSSLEETVTRSTRSTNAASTNGSGKNKQPVNGASPGSHHAAYQLYKEAGEYWNKFPKTDYTYSRRSPHRQELAPGIVTMPNMSRKSIHSFGDQDDYTKATVLTQNKRNEVYDSTYRSHKVFDNYSTYKASERRAPRRLEEYLNSDDTLDEVDYRKKKYYTTYQEETRIQYILRILRITSILTAVSTLFSSAWHKIRKPSSYSSPVRRGGYIEERWYNKVWNGLSWLVCKIAAAYYSVLCRILLLDTWLLKGKQMRTKRTPFVTFLAILFLPLLLLIGAYLFAEHGPPVTLPNISLPPIQEYLPPVSKYAHNTHVAMLDLLEYTKVTSDNYYNTVKEYVQSNFGGWWFWWLFSETSEVIDSLSSNTSSITESTILLLKQIPSYLMALLSFVFTLPSYLLALPSALPIYNLSIFSESKFEQTNTADNLIMPAKFTNNDDSDNSAMILTPELLEAIKQIVRKSVSEHVSQLSLQNKDASPEMVEKLTQSIKDSLLQNNNFVHNLILSPDIISNFINEIRRKDVLKNVKITPEFISQITKELKEHADFSVDGELIAKQQALIIKLTEEMERIKEQLSEKDNSSEQLQNKIDDLKLEHDTLLETINKLKLETAQNIHKMNVNLDSKMKRCCRHNIIQIENYIRRLLVDVVGAQKSNINDEQISAWVKTMFVAKDDLENRLSSITKNLQANFDNLVNASAAQIMETVSEKIHEKFISQQHVQSDSSAQIQVQMNDAINKFTEEQKSALNAFIASQEIQKRELEENLKAQNDLKLSYNDVQVQLNKLKDDLNKFIKVQNVQRNDFLALQKNIWNVQSNSDMNMRDVTVGLNENDIKYIVKKALAQYDADKTGLVDYALEPAGGQVVSTRCTESFQSKTAQVSVFGIPLWYPSNSPRTVISPGLVPGECWAFQGFPGYLVIKLMAKIQLSAFTLEHIPKSLSPSGHIDSAPQNFSVWGLITELDREPVKLGQYIYEDNDESLQYFAVQNAEAPPYDMVELHIESNHGHPNYTCLYRFRVHGTIADSPPPP